MLDTSYLLFLQEWFCDNTTGESGPIGARMRVTIAHSRSKQEAKDAVERSIDHVFTGFNLGAIEFIDQRKQWSGDTMTFTLTARFGFLQTPIRGLAMVTDQDVTLEVDLGLLGKLIPERAAINQIEVRVKGLLK